MESMRIVTLPKSLPNGWDLADALPPNLSGSTLERILADAKEAYCSEYYFNKWESPNLFIVGTGRRASPKFPTHCLGSYWESWVERRAAAASAPVDYVATTLISCTAAMIANVRWPMAGNSWSETPVLWCGIIGPPSSCKSPAMDYVFRIVQKAERKMSDGFDKEYQIFETAKQVAKIKRENWDANIKAAIKSGGASPPFPVEAEIPEEPVRPRVIVSDSTTEALASLAARLPRGLLMARDELAAWIGSFDKYHGGRSDRAFATEMYGGRYYVVDRVKNQRDICINHLSIGVIGSIQPDKISSIICGPDDGFSSRFLWSWPDAIPEFSLCRIDFDDENPRDDLAFIRLTNLKMDIDHNNNKIPKIIKLSEDAENILESFGKRVLKSSSETSGMLSGALGKARGHALRLAAVIEHIWWCCSFDEQEPELISKKATESAVHLLENYFIPMAEKVFSDAEIPVADHQAMTLARYLKSKKIQLFNSRDLRRKIGGPLRESSSMESACTILADEGLVRRQSVSSKVTGRPPKIYEVNPLLHSK